MNIVNPLRVNGKVGRTALEYLGTGYSLLPIARTGSKQPAADLLPRVPDPERSDRLVPSWKPFQQAPPGPEDVARWYAGENPPGIALICGGVSGGLELLDFDHDLAQGLDGLAAFAAWLALVREHRPDVLGRVAVVRTPRDGRHVWTLCRDIDTPGNQVLARAANGKALIATRGEGGYGLAPGCPGACHPTGGEYAPVDGLGCALASLPPISIEEREDLLAFARSLDARPAPPAVTAPADRGPRRPPASGDLTPWKDFDLRGPPWAEILEPHGWGLESRRGEEMRWRRPDKRRGHSATTGRCKGEDGADLLHVFSDNASPFETGKTYGKAAAFALLECNGDFAEMGRKLREGGYGSTPQGNGDGRRRTSRTPPRGGPATPEANGRPPGFSLGIQWLGGVMPEPLRWFVPDMIPVGKLCLLAGDGGHGKSSMSLSLGAAVSRGLPAWGLEYDSPPPAKVLVFSCEDGVRDTIVPRLWGLGADPRRVGHVSGLVGPDGKRAGGFSLRDLDVLADALESDPEIKLCVVDPYGSYLGAAGVDSHKDAEVRALLDPLAQLADRLGVTILGVSHFNKATGASAAARVLGSVGAVNSARAAFAVLPDTQDPDRRLLLPIKANLSKRPRGLAYALEDLTEEEGLRVMSGYGYEGADSDRRTVARQLYRIKWLGPVDRTADDVLREARRAGGEERGPAAAARAAEFIEEFVGDHAWPVAEVDQAARQVGHSDNAIRAAKKCLKGRAQEPLKFRKGGFGDEWWCGFNRAGAWVPRPREAGANGFAPPDTRGDTPENGEALRF
jgi:hypothetical protein